MTTLAMRAPRASTPGKRFAPQGGAAFTLIELLVVIAIIAILAAILFPVFGQAREKARQTACLSNMKQIATGLQLYADDFDGYMPPSQLSQTGSGTGDPVISWPTMMFPYVKNEQVFVCPSGETSPKGQTVVTPATSYCGVTDTRFPNRFSPAHGDGTSLGLGLVNRLSYGRNLIPTTPSAWATTSPNFKDGTKSGFVTTGTTLSVSEAQIEDPAGTIHIVDSWTTDCSFGNSIRGIQQEIRTDHFPNNTASKVARRHNEGFVALYGDGHAKWRKWGSTKARDWSIQQD